MKNIFLSEDVNFFRDFTNFLEARKQSNTEVIDSVRKVIEDVKINKDAAVIKYTKKFDKIDLDRLGLFFEQNEIEESRGKITKKDKAAIDLSRPTNNGMTILGKTTISLNGNSGDEILTSITLIWI